MKNYIFLTIVAILMIATRGHINAYFHLADFTIPALFITGLYFKRTWVALSIIILAVLIDNYAIMYKGISANCITPAYSVLLVSYYFIFLSAKFLQSLSFDKYFVQNTITIIAILIVQWFIATTSYYIFASGDWANFSSYVNIWILGDNSIIGSLSWLGFSAIFITITNHLNNRSLSKSYKDRMVRKKAYIDKRIKEANIEKSVVVLLTGNGKGKSSSALGMICRAISYDMQVGVVKFLKGKIATGEDKFLLAQKNITTAFMQTGFTWDTQNKEYDIQKAEETWQIAQQFFTK